MKRIEVIDAVKMAIIDGGFDGLCNLDNECGCSVDDLAPCGEMNQHCVLGYRGVMVDEDGVKGWGIYETKEAAEDSKKLETSRKP